jgi:hypothetical protein
LVTEKSQDGVKYEESKKGKDKSEKDGDIKNASPRKGGLLASQATFSCRIMKEVFIIRSIKLVEYGVIGVCDEASLSALHAGGVL